MGHSAAALCNPGDNRLSRQRHYHRPGGLNGRVRKGNGCGPASMVAGKPPGRRSSRAGRDSNGWSRVIIRWGEGRNRHNNVEQDLDGDSPRVVAACSGEGTRQRPDRGGQAAWLLGPVG